MKRLIQAAALVVTAMILVSCAATGYQAYNTQAGSVIGGALGALAGQAIGRNTTGTLIGAGAGALAGAVIGNAMDQDRAQNRYYAAQDGYAQRGYGYDRGSAPEAPPGRWMQVPGRWVGGQWVPPHSVWVPVNP